MIFFVFFSSIEILCFLVDYKHNYTSDLYNIVDASYLLLLASYFYHYFVDKDKSKIDAIYPIVNLISWMRGLS